MADAYKCDKCGVLQEGSRSEAINEIEVGEFLVGIMINRKTGIPEPHEDEPNPLMGFGPFRFDAPRRNTDREEIDLCRDCTDEVLRSVASFLSMGEFWAKADSRNAERLALDA